jgi:hypothetical protein
MYFLTAAIGRSTSAWVLQKCGEAQAGPDPDRRASQPMRSFW